MSLDNILHDQLLDLDVGGAGVDVDRLRFTGSHQGHLLLAAVQLVGDHQLVAVPIECLSSLLQQYVLVGFQLSGK